MMTKDLKTALALLPIIFPNEAWALPNTQHATPSETTSFVFFALGFGYSLHATCELLSHITVSAISKLAGRWCKTIRYLRVIGIVLSLVSCAVLGVTYTVKAIDLAQTSSKETSLPIQKLARQL